MSYACVRTDNMSGTVEGKNLVSLRYDGDIENGSIVSIGAFVSGEREVRIATAPSADASLRDLALVATPEVIKNKNYYGLSDFINERGTLIRGYRLTPRDVFSVTRQAFGNAENLTVGAAVELDGGSTKFVAKASPTGSATVIGKIVAIEEEWYVIEVVVMSASAHKPEPEIKDFSAIQKAFTGAGDGETTIKLGGTISMTGQLVLDNPRAVVTLDLNGNQMNGNVPDESLIRVKQGKLIVKGSADGITSIYCFYVSGFERYTTYTETVGDGGWVEIWQNHINKDIMPDRDILQAQIDAINKELQYITDICDVQKFIQRKGQRFYDELSTYWVEGSYSNDNYATYDTTTMAERIDLAQQLMDAARIDLQKASQPKYELTVDAINFIKILEFKQFTDELALGRSVTLEKSDDVLFRMALLSMEYELDTSEGFTLTFSNASKPDETAMTFADLIKESSSVSRTVASNWSNLTDYARNKEGITNLILAPLDRTLRAAQEDMVNQQFIVDDTGILGRKWSDDSRTTFEKEQIRIINNTLLFTNDNWETASLALGKIRYGDNGEEAYGLVADVLIGNLLFGSRMKIINQNGNITFDQNGIVVQDAQGVVHFEVTPDGDVSILNYATSSDLSGATETLRGEIQTSAEGLRSDFKKTLEDYSTTTEMESAIKQSADNITLSVSETLKSYTTKEDVDGKLEDYSTTTEMESAIKVVADSLTAYAKKTEGGVTSAFGYTLTDTQFVIWNGDQNNPVLRCDASGVYIKGTIDATSGHIGSFLITDDGLESRYITLNSKEIRFPIQSSFNLNDEVTIYTTQSGGENTSYITTVNTSNFIIQNLSGAGIKFSKDKSSVSQTITMTFNGPNLASAGDKGNALVINYNIPSPESSWGASYDFPYTATLSAPLPYPCSKTAYLRYLYNIAKMKYRTQSVNLYFPAFTTSISGSVNLKSIGEAATRYNPNDTRFETGVYFTSYSSRTNQVTATVTSYTATNNTLISLGNFSPNEDKKYSLGANDKAWGNLYLYSGTQVGSDIRLKNSVETLSENFDAFFDGLTPVSYVLNNGESHRRHVGFIAQDVELSLKNAGIDTKNFAGLCVPSKDELYYMLRYDEFIALNTSQIQKLKKRVSELEKEIALLSGHNLPEKL